MGLSSCRVAVVSALRSNWSRSAVLALIATLLASSCQDSDPGIAYPTVAPPESTALAPVVGADTLGRALGGSLVYALESDPGVLAPTVEGCGVACVEVLSSLADPMVALTTDGDVVPVLLADIETRDDYFTWELFTREGVSFSDGTRLDPAALAAHLDSCRLSPVTSAWFAPILEIEARDASVVLHLSEPWSSMAEMLVTNPCNWVLAPGSRTRAPVGTGPFRLAGSAEKGGSLAVVKNQDYWRGDRGITGEGLPLLDSVEFVVQPELADRERLLRSGVLGLFHSSTERTDTGTALAATLGAESYQLVFNLGVAGTPEAAWGAIDGCRTFLAGAIEGSRLPGPERLASPLPYPLRWEGPAAGRALDGPNATEPDLDPAACLGSPDGSHRVAILTSSDPVALVLAQSVREQWNSASRGLITVELETVRSAELGRRALVGDFEVLLWASSGGITPEASFPWWHSSSAAPIGLLSLNVGRFIDPEIDAALKRIRVEPDARDEASGVIGESFLDNNWIVWLHQIEWSVAAGAQLVGIDQSVSPDGRPLAPLVNGQHSLAQVWCRDAAC